MPRPEGLPNWTLLYNIEGEFVGTGWEFFTEEEDAQKRYEDLNARNFCATKRPFYYTDLDYMGAAHSCNKEFRKWYNEMKKILGSVKTKTNEEINQKISELDKSIKLIEDSFGSGAEGLRVQRDVLSWVLGKERFTNGNDKQE